MASWWEGIKAAWKVLPRLGDLDPYVKIRQLEDELDEERERRRETEETVRQLEARLEQEAELEPDGNIYWRLDEDGNRDRPTCAPCWEAKDLAITLNESRAGAFICPNCGGVFEHDAVTDERPTRADVRRRIDER